jgi:predicted phosphoadenosine phosphosulfate sulfurtransferase
MENSLLSKINEYQKKWESRCYSNGIPDEVEASINHLVPNWKKIALSILNNDLDLTALGYTKKQSKYYGILKRIELREKGRYNQTSLFDEEL